MKKGIISKRFLLYLLMLMFLVSAFGCSSSDDAAVATTYSISGTVTGTIQEGVTVNLTGAATATTTTATDGTYSFTGLANGTYTVKPELSDYIFNPFSMVVIVNGSSMIADFVAATAPTTLMSIAGTVYLGAAHTARLAGVIVNLTGTLSGSVITDADGWYSFDGIGPGNYTVTPQLSGYAFVDSATDTDPFIDITLGGSSSSNNDFDATPANFTQADLAATWNVQRLEAGSTNRWGRYMVNINAAGTLNFTSCLDSTGSTTCPAGPIVWTINTTTGEITETDNGFATDGHYTMTSNKNFIAGTSTGSSQLFIAQKKKDGISYANADLQSKSFVYHELMVGAENMWGYGMGTTNSDRAVNISSETDPSGTTTPGDVGAIMSVDADGIVSISGTDMSTFRGFLSENKKTIVGTFTRDSSSYGLMVFQITNGQSSSISQAQGVSWNHILGVGSIDFWAHHSMSINSAGVITFDSNWEDNSALLDPPSDSPTLSISSSGAATMSGDHATFHGQLSYDGKFLVATQSYGGGVYSLMVVTK
jgi:hypothetical protein